MSITAELFLFLTLVVPMVFLLTYFVSALFTPLCRAEKIKRYRQKHVMPCRTFNLWDADNQTVIKYDSKGNREQIPFSSLRKGDRFDLVTCGTLRYPRATYGLLAVEDPSSHGIKAQVATK